MAMQFEDAAMEQYFLSLPVSVQQFILQSGVEISTLGELMEIGEHFKSEM